MTNYGNERNGIPTMAKNIYTQTALGAILETALLPVYRHSHEKESQTTAVPYFYVLFPVCNSQGTIRYLAKIHNRATYSRTRRPTSRNKEGLTRYPNRPALALDSTDYLEIIYGTQ